MDQAMNTPESGERPDRVWLVHDRGQQTGPLSEGQIIQRWQSGGYTPQALAWRQGSPQWVPITAVLPPGSPMAGAPPMPYVQASPPPGKVAAGIVAILMPSLGIHKFILGFTNAGLTMLLVTVLTCGSGGIVMHVIGFIEGIIYLTKSDEQFYQDYVVNKKAWF